MQVEGQCNKLSGQSCLHPLKTGPLQTIACPQLIILMRPASYCQLGLYLYLVLQSFLKYLMRDISNNFPLEPRQSPHEIVQKHGCPSPSGLALTCIS